MEAAEACTILGVGSDAKASEVKAAYRRLALVAHPDKCSDGGARFKLITDAYNALKDAPVQAARPSSRPRPKQWGASSGAGSPPEQDWSRYTKEFEADGEFFAEYEKKFWDRYERHASAGEGRGEYDKAQEPQSQPDLSISVDGGLCIGCCSCETIAPGVFEVDKNAKVNPKSRVLDPRGEGVLKVLNAAETCPTKAIRVDDIKAGCRLYPI